MVVRGARSRLRLGVGAHRVTTINTARIRAHTASPPSCAPPPGPPLYAAKDVEFEKCYSARLSLNDMEGNASLSLSLHVGTTCARARQTPPLHSLILDVCVITTPHTAAHPLTKVTLASSHPSVCLFT